MMVSGMNGLQSVEMLLVEALVQRTLSPHPRPYEHRGADLSLRTVYSQSHLDPSEFYLSLTHLRNDRWLRRLG